MMQAFGGYGSYVEDPKDLRGALDEAMNFPGPALVNVKLSQGSQRKAAGVPLALVTRNIVMAGRVPAIHEKGPRRMGRPFFDFPASREIHIMTSRNLLIAIGSGD